MNITEIGIRFADELSRTRALSSAETDMLIRLITEQRKASPRPGKTFWTAKDDRTLRRLRRTHRASEIAAKMGRSVQAVQHRCRRLRQKEGSKCLG